MNERIRLLRGHIDALNDAGVRRTTFFHLVAASLKETLGGPTPIRRAKAFAHVLDNAEQAVLPHELLAGSILGTWPLAEGLPTFAEREQEAVAVLEKYRARKREAVDRPGGFKEGRWAMMARDHYDANVAYGDLQRLIRKMQAHFADAEDISDPEIGRELERHFNFDYGEETRRLFRELPWVVANHMDLNYPKVVRMGLSGIRDDILTRMDRADSPEKRTFYESTLMAVEAAIRFVGRYAETLDAASGAPDVGSDRAAELREMAAICRKVSQSRPETFREALQLMWLVHIIGNIAGGSALSLTRFDQYMYPFYRRDLAEGSVSRQEARDLISCMWLKVNEPHMRTVQSMCLAGTTPDGESAANELTALCLDVCADVKLPYPNISVRVRGDTPEWLWDQVVESIKLGIGQPAILNDDTWIRNLQSVGYSEKDSWDYYNMGCVEIMLEGRMQNWMGCGKVDFPRLIELVLRNGEENMGGDTGPATGTLDSLETFEQFLAAYFEQIRHRAGLARGEAKRQIEGARGRHYEPFASALIDNCLEEGRDLYNGGAKLPPLRAIGGYGLGTATDSLAAIKKFVYDENRLTLRELSEALDADFEGHSDLQKMLDARTPSYGNDIDEVDDIARRVFEVYTDAVHSMNDGTISGPFVTSVFSYTRHVYAGEITAATPNGRNARMPFSETIGPSQGKDVEGPTALINSVTKLDHSRITGACALNLKFTPGLLRGSEGSAALKSLLKTYVQLGGAQVQVNLADDTTMRDAQQHPEKHPNLIVRVAGYCEFFTSLDRNLQDEIISRTAHSV